MVNWQSTLEIAHDSDVYSKLVFALFGVYVWEVFETSDFEWSLITRRRKFTWPLCEYTRLKSRLSFRMTYGNSFFLSLQILAVWLHDWPSPINCQALYTFSSWAGNMAVMCASTSLMLRTIVIWNRNLKVVVPLGFLSLAQWILLWRGAFTFTAVYSEATKSCSLEKTSHVWLNIVFFMTMVFDLVILVFTLVALLPQRDRSGLWGLLSTDGLVFFIIAFCFNALPAILNVLNLNTVMNVIATIPAATFSVIAACRSVMRLQQCKNSDVYVHSSSKVGPVSPVSGTPRHFPNMGGGRGRRSMNFARPEVHVTTDHFVMEDFASSPPSADSDATKLQLQRADSNEDKYSDDDIKGYTTAV
ncbi:uncharacterized protein FIBRA_04942 [Fibroporia radiculosa]|uniref:Transmembrane protein n=1 Tax=Fibroporia radiculosa TaxID=599839 RepID=J4GQ40_9APHY|nr:uncharacterized protein FIBRA_04942 [Fibroporia radiculosa]CCM02830.1 predicted protein [Fibroporia radiculosa]